MSDMIEVDGLKKEHQDLSGYSGQAFKVLTIKVLISILHTLVEIKHRLKNT